MNILRRLNIVWILCLAFSFHPDPATAQCGDVGQPACFSFFNLIQNGELVAEDADFLCPDGQFFDLYDGGACWSCPAGYSRTWDAVWSDTACVRHEDTVRTAAQKTSASWPCSSGQWWDVGQWSCYQCPWSYAHLVFESDLNKACGKVIPKDLKPATRHRDAILGCKPGLADIRGTCQTVGECGNEGQRPCDVTEHVPSCKEIYLKEDFKLNQCVRIKPGETPFLAGLASVGQFWGDGIQGVCKKWLGALEVPADGDLGVGLNCGKDIGVGFACALLREAVGGLTKIDTISSAAAFPGQVGEFRFAVDKAYQSETCLEFEEHLGPAVKHGRADGFDCPTGQFWDPDGFCWSCPNDTTRTLNPVDGPEACVDKFGGEVARSACAVYVAATESGGDELSCTVEVIENGQIFAKPLDLADADHQACMATGELGFTILALGPEIGAAAATGDLTKILGAIGRVKEGFDRAKTVTNLLQCRRQ